MSSYLRLASHIAPFGLVGVLVLLTGFGVWSTSASYTRADQANRAVVISDTYQQIRYDVTVESALQQEYTRQTLLQQEGGGPPDTRIVLVLDSAAANVGSVLLKLMSHGRPQDRILASHVLAEHDHYLQLLERVQDAVFRRDAKRAGLLLDTELQPLSDAIATQVNSVAITERKQAVSSLGKMRAQAEFTGTMTIVVFGAGLFLLSLFWWALLAFEKHIGREQQAVRLSEERYRTLVDISPDGVVVTDPAGIVLMTNRRAAESLGYSGSEELVGREAHMLVAEEDRWRISELRNPHMHVADHGSTEYRLCKRDGTTFPAEISSSLLINERGGPE